MTKIHTISQEILWLNLPGITKKNNTLDERMDAIHTRTFTTFSLEY